MTSEYEQFFEVDRAQAASTAVFALNDKPDEAARAQELGDVTGVNPALIYPNVKQFEDQQKALVTKRLFDQNRFLREYVSNDPLAAKVSNDDWGQLDVVTEAVQKHNKESILVNALRGFAEGFGEGGLGATWIKPEDMEKAPLAASAWSVLGAPIEGFFRFGSGAITGIARAAEAAAVKAGLSPDDAKTQADNFIHAAGDPGLWASLGPVLHTVGQPFMMAAHNAALREAAKIEPFTRDGRIPPPGISPITDALHVAQAESDAATLQAALKESVASATRERSPESFKRFMDHVVGDTEIGITPDAVRRLYGEKMPEAGDNILGWVPDIQQKLEIAEATGTDIRVPLADWLAKVDPTVAKELENDVRARPNGLTLEEAKTFPTEDFGNKTGFSKSELKELLDAEDAQLVNMWNEVQEAKDKALPEGTMYTKQLQAYAKQLDELGVLNLSSEAEVRQALLDRRLRGETVQATGGEIIDLAPNVADELVTSVREATGVERVLTEQRIQEKQLELPVEGTTRLEDRDIFEKASAIGMTVDQYQRYQALIEKRAAEDLQAQTKRLMAAERRRQTADWKAKLADIRGEVTKEIEALPEFEIDAALRNGEFKLREEFLTEEQKALLPKNWVAARGIHPDDLAQLYGVETGAEAVAQLANMVEQRKASGLRPIEFTREVIRREAERRMEERYGKLEEKIIEEVKDQILTQTQLDLLHEETLAAATRAGTELPISKEQILDGVRDAVNRTTMKEISSDRFMADAGRAGKKAEMALLKGDAAEAFRQKQRQYLAVAMAAEARLLEKDMAALDKTAKPYEARDMGPKVDPAGRFYIQGLLQQAGYKVKLLPEEITKEIEAYGHGSLADFAAYKQGYGWEPAVADWLLEKGAKPIKEMTAEEFRGFKDAIDSLNFIAREEQKIEIAGAKQDFADYKRSVINNLKERPVRPIEELEKGGKWLYRLDAPMTRMEEIVKDIDLRKDLGPLYQGLIVPFEQSKAKSYQMLKDLAAQFNKIDGFDKKWQRSLDVAIPNDFVFDTYNQSMFRLTRWNMIKMMLNWGNESNRGKLVDGIADAAFGGRATPDQAQFIRSKIERLFNQHATKEDWTFVQKVWDIFEGYRGEVETLERNMGGRVPKWISGSEIETPHGKFKGGYFPLMPDFNRNPKLRLEDAPETSGPLGKDYFRATTNQNHLIARKGARYFVDITNGPEQLVGRMQQIIHDLSFRDFVKQAGKIIYDPEIRHAIKKHYGPEYLGQMEPWLKRVANMATINEAELQWFNDILGKARLNLIAAALPLNYSVMLSPSLGTLNPAAMFRFNSNRTANMKMVMENSKEIPNLLYTLDRDINNALRTQLGKQGWTSFQLHAMETMFKPLIWIEQQFRMVTFYDEFTKQKAKGLTDFEAATLADSLVRERHSVSHTGDLPAILASKNEFVKMSTVFMGYFSTQRNWMRQVPELARQGEYSQVAKVLWGTMGIATLYNAALFTKRKENEGFFHWMGRAVLSTPLQMVPFIRDAWNYASEGFQPTSPVAGLITSVYEVGMDGYTALKGKTVKKPAKHILNAAGQVLGLPGAMQIGRTGEFIHDVITKEQRPRDIVEWMRGIATGEAKRQKR